MSAEQIITKACHRCRAELPAHEFYADKSKKHGLSSACRTCCKARAAKVRSDNPDKNKTYLAAWRKANPEKSRESCKNWRENNPERAKELSRIYRHTNKDDVRAKRKEWESENRDVVRRLARETYARNKEKKQEKNRRHYAENKEIYRARDRNRHAMELACEGSHTAEEIIALYEFQQGKCASPVCGHAPLHKDGPRKFHADHMDPLSRGGSNWIANIQLLCPTCNRKKGAKTMEEFLNVYWRPK